MTEEFLCARCARHTRTCCQDTEIHVTLGDMRRILPFAGETEFAEFRRPSQSVYDQSLEDPVWHRSVFQPDGTRQVLKQHLNGDCVFLGALGCRLPSEVRPLVCRLYPFDYSADGIHNQLAAGCPVELLRPEQRLLEVLNMNIDDARQLHAQLYREIDERDADRGANTAVRTALTADFSSDNSALASVPEKSRLHENRPHLRSA